MTELYCGPDLQAETDLFITEDFFRWVPSDPLTQLRRAYDFAMTVPHGKFAFQTGGGGFCMRGYLTAANGIVLTPGKNFAYPFSGEAQTTWGETVDLSIFNEADKILNDIVQGAVMALNDTAWFDKDYALALLDMAVDEAAK